MFFPLFLSGAQYRTAGYPPKYNDPALVQMGFRSAIELFKEEDGSTDIDKIILNDESTALGGEDFAFFYHLGGVPSAMFSIGHQSDDDPMTGTAHHNENFKVRAHKASSCTFHTLPVHVILFRRRIASIDGMSRHLQLSVVNAQVNEGMLYRGAAFYAQLALDFLNGNSV